MKHTKSSVN